MPDAFSQELVALLPNLRRFAIALCRSRDIADDLVQTTCEKALQARASYQPGTRLDAWLFRILRNSWIDQTRRQKTEGPRIDVADAHFLVGQDGERTTEARLALDATAKAIATLPDDQREVLIMVCVEDLTYREAADVLSVPVGTIMSRLARARRKLVDQLGIDTPTKRSEDQKGLM